LALSTPSSPHASAASKSSRYSNRTAGSFARRGVGLHGVGQNGEERLAVPALELAAAHERQRQLRALLELGGVADVRRDLSERRAVVHLPRARLRTIGSLRALGFGRWRGFRLGRGLRRRPLRRREVVKEPHRGRAVLL
jgi:hypothetical protein